MNTNNLTVVPRKIFQRKPGFSGCPEFVSPFGALPQPLEAYELVEKGFSIYDSKENSYHNYFFGKIGIETREEGAEIIRKLGNI